MLLVSDVERSERFWEPSPSAAGGRTLAKRDGSGPIAKLCADEFSYVGPWACVVVIKARRHCCSLVRLGIGDIFRPGMR